MKFDIVAVACFVLGYELVAIAMRWPTWTRLAHRPAGAPVWIFWAWLGIHLARGEPKR